jgi:hypothetical protein
LLLPRFLISQNLFDTSDFSINYHKIDDESFTTLTDSVISNFPDKNKDEIFLKTLDWIRNEFTKNWHHNQSNPQSTPVINVVNDTINFEFYASNLVSTNGTEFHQTKCKAQFTFNDSSYKLKILKIEYKFVGWQTLNMSVDDVSMIFHPIQTYFRLINKSLKDAISSDKNKVFNSTLKTETQIKILNQEIDQVNLRLKNVDKFGKQHRTGNHLMLSGIIFNAIGLGIIGHNSAFGSGIIIAGSALSTVGWIINIDSFKHLKN